MPSATIAYGAFLIALGLIGYLLTGAGTSLIPAALGLIAVGLGAAARNQASRRHAMHGAAALALVGLLVSVARLVPSIGSGAFGTAQVSLSLLALASLAYLALSVRSFREARALRQNA